MGCYKVEPGDKLFGALVEVLSIGRTLQDEVQKYVVSCGGVDYTKPDNSFLGGLKEFKLQNGEVKKGGKVFPYINLDVLPKLGIFEYRFMVWADNFILIRAGKVKEAREITRQEYERLKAIAVTG